MPALDGLRGVAALLVVLAHVHRVGLAAEPPPMAGPLGVMLFFVLSGFLMGYLYLEKPFDRPSSIHFIAARIARVFPLYYLAVVVSFILSKALGPSFSFYLSDVHFVRLMLLSGHSYVFWSIPPEVQFYLIFLVIWAVAQAGKIGLWLPVLLLTVATIFFLRPLFPGISALGQLQIFLTGVAVAVLRRRFAEQIRPNAALIVQTSGIIAIVLAVTGVVPVEYLIQGMGRSKDDIAYASMPLALIVGSFVLACSIDTKFGRAVLANRVAERLGAFSFGLYLLHWPIMQLVYVFMKPTGASPITIGVVGAGIAIAGSAVVHHAYEMPIQRALRPTLAQLLNRAVLIFSRSPRPMA